MSHPSSREHNPRQPSPMGPMPYHQMQCNGGMSPLELEISAIFDFMPQDIGVQGIYHLGSDGVLRSLDADRNVLNAAALSPALIKASLDCVPYDEKVERRYKGADGTKVPVEQWFNPPKEILPPPLTREERWSPEQMEERKMRHEKMKRDVQNGTRRWYESRAISNYKLD